MGMDSYSTDQSTHATSAPDNIFQAAAQSLGAIFLSLFMVGLACLGVALMVGPLVLLVTNPGAIDALQQGVQFR